jgi:tetratricopeptide (TPR) repeat protein
MGNWLVSPLTSIFDGGNEPPEEKPFYSIAMTKRNRGRPLEAVAEIRRQLERFPYDFEGVMLLARVQAEDLGNLGAAEIALNHFCDRADAPLKQVAAAYLQLADWHLKLGADADAARSALQRIITRYPDTETALMAEQRIAHLSDAEKMILAQHDRRKIDVPAGVGSVGLLDSTDFLKPREVEPGRLAAACVKQLQAHPHDTEARETLALIYARDYRRLDMATMELAQMINEPKHKPKQIVHWLNLLATLQIELGADATTVRATLEKIVESFPDLPLAELARRRLGRLENEFKGLRATSNVKLGSYEQNIGLKYGGPRKP